YWCPLSRADKEGTHAGLTDAIAARVQHMHVHRIAGLSEARQQPVAERRPAGTLRQLFDVLHHKGARLNALHNVSKRKHQLVALVGVVSLVVLVLAQLAKALASGGGTAPRKKEEWRRANVRWSANDNIDGVGHA